MSIVLSKLDEYGQEYTDCEIWENREKQFWHLLTCHNVQSS